MIYYEVLGDKSAMYIRVLDYIVTISFAYILYCGCFNLFCNVWVCVSVGVCMCGCFGNMCTSIYCVFLFFVLCFLYCLAYVYLFLFVLSVLV